MGRFYGVHTSIAGTLLNAVKEAKTLGCTAFQIFLQSPRNWSHRNVVKDEILKFKEALLESGISFFVVHCSYLINLLSLRKEVVRKSVELINFELEMSEAIGASCYVLHLRENREEPFEKQMEKLIERLGLINYRGSCKILIENSAGGANFSNISKLARIYLDLKDQFAFLGGLCLDTAHLFAAGYELDEKGCRKIVNELGRAVYDVRLLHLNDCACSSGSGVDRHAHLGSGHIGLSGLRRFLLLPEFKYLPVILETPRLTIEDDVRNLKTLLEVLLKDEETGWLNTDGSTNS